MIIFKNIRYKNFLSTGNDFTEFKFDTHATTLIYGKNGSGKSTLLDAISFALFGKAYRNVNKPQLINSINGKDCIVEIEFSIGKIEYKIVRGIKPAIFEIHKNGEIINKLADSDDYQLILEKQIIKANHKSFCQIVILGSSTFKPFMQLSKPERRKIIEDLLDLEIFSIMNELNKKKILDNTSEIKDVLFQRKTLEEKIVLINDNIKQLNISDQELIKDKEENIVHVTELMNNILVEIKELKKSIKEFPYNLASLNKDMKKYNSFISKFEVKKETAKHNINFFNKHDNCPTCTQEIEASLKITSIEEYKKELKKYEEGIIEAKSQLKEVESKLKEVGEVTQFNFNIEKDIIKKQSNISFFKSQIENDKKFIEKYSAIKKNPNTDKLKEFETELENVKNSYNRLMEEKQIYAAASIDLKDDGIKARMIKKYIPIINNTINYYLEKMEFMCLFELNEEFKETIKSRYCDEFTYDSFSEGEKLKINLAILFAWRNMAKKRNSINTNLLVMDEILDSSLDVDSIDNLYKVLEEYKDNNVFIISHRENFSDKFDDTIQFKKIRNFSMIV